MEEYDSIQVKILTDYWKDLKFFKALTDRFSKKFNKYPRESVGIIELIQLAFDSGYTPRAKRFKEMGLNNYKEFKNLWWKTIMISKN